MRGLFFAIFHLLRPAAAGPPILLDLDEQAVELGEGPQGNHRSSDRHGGARGVCHPRRDFPHAPIKTLAIQDDGVTVPAAAENSENLPEQRVEPVVDRDSLEYVCTM